MQAQRISDDLSAELGRPPRIDELAARLGVPPEAAREAVGAVVARDARSLDAPSEGPSDGGRQFAPDSPWTEDEGLGRALDRTVLRSALQQLSDEERLTVGLRFVADFTQTEIARCVGISQMQVSRVLRRALDRLEALALDGDSGGLSADGDGDDASLSCIRPSANGHVADRCPGALAEAVAESRGG